MDLFLTVGLRLASICWFEQVTAILLNRQVYFKMQIFLNIILQILVLGGLVIVASSPSHLGFLLMSKTETPIFVPMSLGMPV